MALPVDFRQKVRLPPAAGANGYPYSISADDLMKNFLYLDFDAVNQQPLRIEVVNEDAWGPVVRKSVRIAGFPPPPESGTHVLGSVNGVLQWIETTDCDEETT